MSFRSCVLCAGIGLLLSNQAVANTVVFGYSLTGLGSNVYRYDYSIYNNGSLGAGVPIQLFDILFDTGLYLDSSLLIVTPAPLQSQWSETWLSQLPQLPAAYDVLALGGGIPVGSWVSGFAVQFTWLGPGLPGSQPFRIYSPQTFEVLQTGNTSPEPSFFGALGLSLAYGVWKVRRRQASTRTSR